MPTPIRCYSYIRFSTPEQLKGDSLRRQLKLSEDYAEKHKLILDKNFSYKDLGKSAFRGQNREKGMLGVFLEAVKNGLIPSGSILLVESLDRLSRETVLDAFTQFREIIKLGIRIVTLVDEVEYSEKSLRDGFEKLIISLSIMARAHEESLSKSRRISAAWNSKRQNIDQKILTRRCVNSPLF